MICYGVSYGIYKNILLNALNSVHASQSLSIVSQPPAPRICICRNNSNEQESSVADDTEESRCMMVNTDNVRFSAGQGACCELLHERIWS